MHDRVIVWYRTGRLHLWSWLNYGWPCDLGVWSRGRNAWGWPYRWTGHVVVARRLYLRTVPMLIWAVVWIGRLRDDRASVIPTLVITSIVPTIVATVIVPAVFIAIVPMVTVAIVPVIRAIGRVIAYGLIATPLL